MKNTMKVLERIIKDSVTILSSITDFTQFLNLVI